MNSNPWYTITYTEYKNSNTLSRNSENKKDLYQNFKYQGFSHVIISIENSAGIIIGIAGIIKMVSIYYRHIFKENYKTTGDVVGVIIEH